MTSEMRALAALVVLSAVAACTEVQTGEIPSGALADSGADLTLFGTGDAASPDLGATPDPGTTLDPGTAPDPGGAPDPGSTPDPGMEPDPGAAPDLGGPADPGFTPDPGGPADPGAEPDPGSTPDPGGPADPGTTSDPGPPDPGSADVPPDPTVIGCSDGTREGFLDANATPMVAACSGAWTVPGIHHAAPDCGREGGNDGVNAVGAGCNVEDLCAEGWHVCLGKTDVLVRNDDGCAGIMDGAQRPAFWLARTSSTGAFNCAPDTIGDPSSNNDLFGCGDLGCTATVDTCAPLTQASHDLCKTLKNKPTSSCSCNWNADHTDVVCSPSSGGCGWCKPLDYYNLLLDVDHPDAWDCGSDGNNEAANAIKTEPDQQGGVLCCIDL